MFEQFVSCGLIFIFLFNGACAKLPADIKPCQAGDKVCLVDTINKIISTKFNGDSDLNLVSIDPLKIPKMRISPLNGSPANIEIRFKNIEVFGNKDFRAIKVRGFGANPEGKHEIYFHGPSLSMIADYAAKGNVLSLIVDGKGKSNITMDETKLKIVINAESLLKDDLVYMDVKNVEMNLLTKRMHFAFANITFNGDKTLSDQLIMNLNENWEPVYEAIRPTIQNSFGLVYSEFIRQVFATHPYKELIEGGN